MRSGRLGTVGVRGAVDDPRLVDHDGRRRVGGPVVDRAADGVRAGGGDREADVPMLVTGTPAPVSTRVQTALAPPPVAGCSPTAGSPSTLTAAVVVPPGKVSGKLTPPVTSVVRPLAGGRRDTPVAVVAP